MIGVGLLGSAIAKRLMQQGISVHAFDLDEKQVQSLQGERCRSCLGAKEVIQNCEIVIFSLPTSDDVLKLIEQISDSVRPGQIILDTTTGDPTQMVTASHLLKNLNVNYLEANVAGSSDQAQAGEIVLFLGGDVAVAESAKQVLSTISKQQFHMGSIGQASRFKLVHNMVLGLHRAVLAEGLAFAEALGFAPDQALKVLEQTPAYSGVMKTKGKRMTDRKYELQARLSQHLKDVRLILSEVKRSQTIAPLSDAHKMLLEQAETLGYGESDNSAVIEAYRQTSPKLDS